MNRLILALVTSTSLLVGASVYSLSYAQDTNDRTAGTQPSAVEEKKDYNETYKQLNLFGEVFERIRMQYVEELSDKEIIEHALNGMLASLDPHSSYLNEESFNDMKVETKGAFGGLGIEVTMDSGLVKVVAPIDDTPAFRAGMQAGDYIVKIDNQPVMGLNLDEAVEKLRGKVGSPIDLEIRREGVEAPILLTLTRDIIKIQSVRHRVEGNVGYVRITTFNQNAGSGLKEAIEDIKKELGDKLIGYVLDLRNNPGGLLDQAIEVSDSFLEGGEIVSTRGRHEEDTERDNATPGDLADGLPVVVLINGGSASASEIVAGALQDHKRAIIMGTKSFGKGSVQTVIPLPGNGAMRLTTSRYYTPSGRSIQAKGIDPDIFVEPATVEVYKQTLIAEADLKGALSSGQADPQKVESTDTTKAEPKKPSDDKNVKSDGKDGKKTVEEEKPQDYQLMRAIDLLTGLSLYAAKNDVAPEPASALAVEKPQEGEGATDKQPQETQQKK